MQFLSKAPICDYSETDQFLTAPHTTDI